MMQDIHIFGFESFFFLITPLKEFKENFSSSIGLTLAIINSKVVLREFLSPPDLSGARALYIDKLFKVVMVC